MPDILTDEDLGIGVELSDEDLGIETPRAQYSPEVIEAAQRGIHAPFRPSLEPVFAGQAVAPRFKVEAPAGMPSYEERLAVRQPGGQALGLGQEFAALPPEEQQRIKAEDTAKMFESFFGPHASKWWGDQTQESLESARDYLKSNSAGATFIKSLFPEISAVAETKEFPKIVAGLISTGVGFGEFATSPAGIYTAAAARFPGGPRLISALFLADTIRKTPEAGTQLGEAVSKGDWRQATEIIAGTAGIGALTGYGTFRGGRPAIRRELRQWAPVQPPPIPPRFQLEPPEGIRAPGIIARPQQIQAMAEQVPLAEQALARSAAEAEAFPRRRDFEAARAEATAEQVRTQVGEGVAAEVHPEKPLSENSLRIVADSIRREIAKNSLTDQRKGIISGTAAEAWADRFFSEPGVHTIGPDMVAAWAIKGAAILERGIVDAAEWTAEMIRRFPELKDWAKENLNKIREQAVGLRNNQVITKTLSKPLEDEIAHKISTFEESKEYADLGETFTRSDAIKELIQDMDDKGTVAYELRKPLQDLGIELGIFKPYTAAQLASMVITRGKKYDFKRGDTFYRFENFKPLQKGTYALQEQKAGEVSGRLPEQPGIYEREVSAKEGAGGIPSGVQGKAEAGGAEVSVRPPHRVEPPAELKDLFDKEGVIYIGKLEGYDLGGGKKTREMLMAEIYDPIKDPQGVRTANVAFSPTLSHAEISKKIAEKREAFGWKRPDEVTFADRMDARLESLKIRGEGQVGANPFPEIARSVWNTSLDVMQTAIRAGKSMAQAVNAFVAHLRGEGVKFDEPKIRSYWNEQSRMERPMQMVTPEGSPERFPVESAEEIKMRKSAARATQSPDIPQEVRTRIAEAPESFYPTQKVPSVQALVSGMSDAELSAVQVHSNVYVAARLEQANRLFKSGNNDAGYDVFAALEREGTNFGQLVNQFKLLKGVNPQSVVDLVNSGLRKAGYDPLKDAQRENLRSKSEESISKNRDLETAKDNWVKEPTDENAAKAERALNEADKADLEVQRLVHKYQHRSLAAVLKAIIQGNTLTPISQVANFVGNLSGLPFRQGNRGGAAIIDSIDAFLRSRPREITVQPVSGTKAAFQGALEGIKQMPAILRWGPGNVVKGESRAGLHPIQAMVNLLSKTPDVPTAGGRVPFLDRVSMALEATFGVPAEIMLRGLSVGDVAPKLAARSRLLAESFRLKKVPRDKWALAQKFPELFLDRETLARVENEMQRAVFQQPSTALNYFNRLLKEKGGDTADLAASIAGAIYRLTPWNVTKEILSWNPLVALGQTAFEAKRGNIRGAEMAASRFVLGSAVTAAGYWLYQKGMLSPSLDQPDEEQRARILAQEVMPPNHVNVSALRRTLQRYSKGQTPTNEDFGYQPGDETRDIFRSGFIGGSMLYMVANIGRDFEKKRMDESENLVASIVQDSVLQQMRFGIQQTMLKGTAAALDAILKGNIDGYINSVMGTTLSVAVPNSMTAVSRTLREYQVDMKEPEFKQRVNNLVRTRLGFLGLDDYMPLKRDLWGRPMRETPEGSKSLIYHFFDVTKGKQVTSDPIALELYRLWRKTANPSVIPSIPSRRMTVQNQSYQLNSKQYERLAELIGQNRLNIVQLVVTNPNFHQLSDENRIALLQDVYRDGSQIGRALFLQEHGQELESQPTRAGFEAE